MKSHTCINLIPKFPRWQKLLFLSKARAQSDICSCFLCLANDQCTQNVGEELVETTFTLICDVEPWFVLWIVTVEEEAGLVSGAEQRLGDDWTAEPVNDRAQLQYSTADLQIIMDCFSREVQKLEMDTWETFWHLKQLAKLDWLRGWQ